MRMYAFGHIPGFGLLDKDLDVESDDSEAALLAIKRMMSVYRMGGNDYLLLGRMIDDDLAKAKKRSLSFYDWKEESSATYPVSEIQSTAYYSPKTRGFGLWFGNNSETRKVYNVPLPPAMTGRTYQLYKYDLEREEKVLVDRSLDFNESVLVGLDPLEIAFFEALPNP